MDRKRLETIAERCFYYGMLVIVLALIVFTFSSRGCATSFIIAVLDDHDHQHFGFRNPWVKTPTLDKIARKGITFDNAWVQSKCAPSLASILTGLGVEGHGRTWNRDRTGCDRNIDPKLSFLHDLPDHRAYQAGKWWFGPRAFMGFENGQFGNHLEGGQTALFSWLDSIGQDDFLIFWAPPVPHRPWTPPQQDLDAIDPCQIPIPGYFTGDPMSFRQEEHLLLGMVHWFDRELGRLLDKVLAIGRAADTMVIVLSDNGWANGLQGKGSPYETAMQSPILVAAAGLPRNERRAHLVTLRDVRATVLDYAGVAHAPRSDGQSLRRWIEDPGDPGRTFLVDAVFDSESLEKSVRGAATALCARTVRYKSIAWLQSVSPADDQGIVHHLTELCDRQALDVELYDLMCDPRELVNVSGRQDLLEVEKALSALMQDHLSRL